MDFIISILNLEYEQYCSLADIISYLDKKRASMQIREMDYKELYEIYELIKQLHQELSYESFEDLMYDMRHVDYKMFGLFERGELLCFAGGTLQTTLLHKRHLCVYDFVTDEKWRFLGYGKAMLLFLEDYAKTAMCENLLLDAAFEHEDAQKFYEKKSFKKESFCFVKPLLR